VAKGKKSFTEKIKDDFKPVTTPKVKETPSKARTKAVPGARLVHLSDIFLDSNQPRKKADKEKLDELAASIRSKGVIEPITVRFVEDDGNYRIVTGERRYKAAELAGLTEIPCIVKDLDDQEALTYQLIENLQREDLPPIDEATGIKQLMDNGLTQSEVAKLIGKSQPYISKLLKILELPKDILDEAQEQQISKEHLLQLKKSEDQQTLWQDIKEGKTAKEIKEKIRKEKPSKGRPKIKPWTWKPEDKSFTISIKFKKQNYGKEELIRALYLLLDKLKQLDLFEAPSAATKK